MFENMLENNYEVFDRVYHDFLAFQKSEKCKIYNICTYSSLPEPMGILHMPESKVYCPSLSKGEACFAIKDDSKETGFSYVNDIDLGYLKAIKSDEHDFNYGNVAIFDNGSKMIVVGIDNSQGLSSSSIFDRFLLLLSKCNKIGHLKISIEPTNTNVLEYIKEPLLKSCGKYAERFKREAKSDAELEYGKRLPMIIFDEFYTTFKSDVFIENDGERIGIDYKNENLNLMFDGLLFGKSFDFIHEILGKLKKLGIPFSRSEGFSYY